MLRSQKSTRSIVCLISQTHFLSFTLLFSSLYFTYIRYYAFELEVNLGVKLKQVCFKLELM